MPNLPEKIDDWTPPWAEGEFDADKAKALVFNALKGQEKAKAAKAAADSELAETKTKLSTAEATLSAKPGEEAAKDKEISELRSKVQTLESGGRESDADRINRLEIALEKGLTVRQAARLVGKTRDELEEDADALREELGLTNDDGESGSSGSGEAPPPQRQPLRAGEAGNGRNRREEEPQVYSVDELRKQKRDGEVSLPPLGR